LDGPFEFAFDFITPVKVEDTPRFLGACLLHGCFRIVLLVYAFLAGFGTGLKVGWLPEF
jgi:hypothetical protein